MSECWERGGASWGALGGKEGTTKVDWAVGEGRGRGVSKGSAFPGPVQRLRRTHRHRRTLVFFLSRLERSEAKQSKYM